MSRTLFARVLAPAATLATALFVACAGGVATDPEGDGRGGDGTGGAGTPAGGETGGPGGVGGATAGGSDGGVAGGAGTAGTGGATGGTPGTGGAPGGGGTGAGGAGTGGAPLPPSGRLYSEDFEKYADMAVGGGTRLGSLTGSVSGATMAIDQSKAFGGKKSLHIRVPAGSGRQAWLNYGNPIAPMPNNMLYGRAMIFLSENPNADVHWNYFRSSGPGRDAMGRSINVVWDWGSHTGALQAFYSQNDCWWRNGTVRMAPGRWACWRWLYDGSSDGAGGVKSEMKVWLDLEEQPKIHVRGQPHYCSGGPVVPWMSGQWRQGYIGWENAQPTPIVLDVWYDDIAFDMQPIACPAGFVPAP